MTYRMIREATNRVLEMIEEGLLDPMTVVQAALCYMSEDDVADMCHANDFFYEEEDEEPEDEEPEPDESMDGDFDSGMASAGFGTDEDYGCYQGDE